MRQTHPPRWSHERSKDLPLAIRNRLWRHRRQTVRQTVIQWTSIFCGAAATVIFLGFSAMVVAQHPRSGQPAAGPNQPSGNTIDIVAVVNGQPFDREFLAQQCAIRFGEEVLQSMVNKMLIWNEIQQRNIMISEQDVMDELTRQAERYGLSAQRYVALLESERNVSADKLKNDIIWMDLALRRLAAERIEVSPNEIAERMEFEFGPKVQVSAIAAATREDAEKLLAYVREKPAEFGNVAKDHSIDTQSAAVRGLLPPIRKNLGEPILERAAFGLEKGEISDVIEAGSQFIILKCEQHFPAADLPPDQRSVAEQRVAEQLKQEKLADAAAELFMQLQDNSSIVNVYNDPKLREQMPGVAATVNGTPISLRKVYEECISRFGQDVLKAEINRAIVMQALQRANLTVTQQDIEDEMARAAETFGFIDSDGSPDIDRWLAYVTQGQHANLDIYIQDEVWPSAAVRKLVEPRIQVTDEDMHKAFESNFGPRVEVLAIVLNDQRMAQRVWQMARANPTEEYFGQLANQYSVEPASRANFGLVPPIQKHGGRPRLEEEAFRLQSGEMSGLIEVGPHWIILWCQGRTTPIVQEFEAVKSELYADIRYKKLRIAMAEEFDRLIQEAQIDNFLEGTSQPGARAIEAARQQSPVPR